MEISYGLVNLMYFMLCGELSRIKGSRSNKRRQLLTCFTNSLFKVYNNLSSRETGPEVYNNNTPVNVTEVKEQMLWYNHHDKVLYEEMMTNDDNVESSLLTSSLLKICFHFYNVKGPFLTYQQIVQKFGQIIHPATYISLVGH